MSVDLNPFLEEFVTHMVHVDMRGATRTVPRQKMSLGAPSRAAKGKHVLYHDDKERYSPIWWDQEVIRSRKGS